jgi:hypothetical protein
MAAYTGVGPGQADFQNSSLLSADSYALLRSITGGYVVFKDSSFWKGGVLDFLYKMGNIKDTTTRDIYHFEKNSIIPIGVCSGAVTVVGGGVFTIPVTALTNGAFPYNPDGIQPNQTPPNSLVNAPGPTFSFGIPGEIVIAKNGTLRGTITSKTSTTITIKTGSVNTTSWASLASGDKIKIVSRTSGERDPFQAGYSQTNTRFATTIQTIEASTPELTSAALSQQRSYSIMGQNFVGPEYLEDLNTRYAAYEAYAMLLGNGQTTSAAIGSNTETRTEILGILPAAQTLGKDNGTIVINATTTQAIANYNFENEGGNNLAVFAGRDAQFAISAYFRTPASGFTNGGITFDSEVATGLKKINLDFDNWKVGGTNFMVGSAIEFNNPRITGGLDNATAAMDVYSKTMLMFPMGDTLAHVTNPQLTSGATTQSTPFGFNTYYEVPRDFKGATGTGRMLRISQGPENLGRPAYLETVRATILQQYIAGVKLQAANV